MCLMKECYSIGTQLTLCLEDLPKNQHGFVCIMYLSEIRLLSEKIVLCVYSVHIRRLLEKGGFIH